MPTRDLPSPGPPCQPADGRTFESPPSDRWFPPLLDQLLNFVREGCLVTGEGFEACTRAYYGTITFQEAFERTGRIVNINISASSRGRGGHQGGALLLNHLTAPHVLLASAVHASCSLPTVMKSTTLVAKAADGALVPFTRAEEQWIDGSFTADIPRKRLSELFHVTQDIVSQVKRD